MQILYVIVDNCAGFLLISANPLLFIVGYVPIYAVRMFESSATFTHQYVKYTVDKIWAHKEFMALTI